MEAICMKYQILFGGKYKKIITNYRLLKFLLRVLNVNISGLEAKTCAL